MMNIHNKGLKAEWFGTITWFLSWDPTLQKGRQTTNHVQSLTNLSLDSQLWRRLEHKEVLRLRFEIVTFYYILVALSIKEEL